jgi:hypothetical protein
LKYHSNFILSLSWSSFFHIIWLLLVPLSGNDWNGGYVEPQSGLYGICKLFFILYHSYNQKQSLNNRKISRCFATNQNNKIVDVERHLQIPYTIIWEWLKSRKTNLNSPVSTAHNYLLTAVYWSVIMECQNWSSDTVIVVCCLINYAFSSSTTFLWQLIKLKILLTIKSTNVITRKVNTGNYSNQNNWSPVFQTQKSQNQFKFPR